MSAETLMLASNLLEGERRAGTVGYPLPGSRCRCATGRTNGEDGRHRRGLGQGADGLPGYWRNAEATAYTFTEGWFRTGDVGELDAAGCLTLRGRATELIISGGFNIYPREIEEVLLEQPGVREAAVVGVLDPRRGEVPVAYVVTEPGVDLDSLRDRCAASLASWRRRRGTIVRVDAPPRNAMGKLQKRSPGAAAGALPARLPRAACHIRRRHLVLHSDGSSDWRVMLVDAEGIAAFERKRAMDASYARDHRRQPARGLDVLAGGGDRLVSEGRAAGGLDGSGDHRGPSRGLRPVHATGRVDGRASGVDLNVRRDPLRGRRGDA